MLRTGGRATIPYLSLYFLIPFTTWWLFIVTSIYSEARNIHYWINKERRDRDMLKYQVRTLGRERRRQSTPLREVFTTTCTSSTDTAGGRAVAGSVSAPSSPWHDLSRTRGRSTSVSSLSSASTSSDTAQEWSTIRIYTSLVRPDTDYKTLFANANTTAAELIQLVLNKFRIHFKDPELFYLTMELTTKHEATEVRHAVALDSGAKPLVLQSCYPTDRCRFVLQIRQSFPVRVYDSSFCTASNYKTVMVSQSTTSAETVQLVMKTRNDASSASPSARVDSSDDQINSESHRNPNADYGIVLVDIRTRKEIMLHPDESIFTALYETGRSGQYQLHLRPLRHCRFDSYNPRVMNCEENQPTYQRKKVTPTIMARYADDDYANGRTDRLRDYVI